MAKIMVEAVTLSKLHGPPVIRLCAKAVSAGARGEMRRAELYLDKARRAALEVSR